MQEQNYINIPKNYIQVYQPVNFSANHHCNMEKRKRNKFQARNQVFLRAGKFFLFLAQSFY